MRVCIGVRIALGDGRPRRQGRTGVLMRVLGLLLVSLLLDAPAVLAQEPARDEADIERAVNGIVEAVENADMPGFLAFFDEDATMFHNMAQSSGNAPRRLQGRTDIERSMRGVLTPSAGPEAQLKENSGRTTGPYVQIQPLDRMVQTYDQFAVVSFHLGSAPAISRRTLVFRKVASAWKVVHLHGSLLQTETPDCSTVIALSAGTRRQLRRGPSPLPAWNSGRYGVARAA